MLNVCSKCVFLLEKQFCLLDSSDFWKIAWNVIMLDITRKWSQFVMAKKKDTWYVFETWFSKVVIFKDVMFAIVALILWGNDWIWREYFQIGVVQLPTSLGHKYGNGTFPTFSFCILTMDFLLLVLMRFKKSFVDANFNAEKVHRDSIWLPRIVGIVKLEQLDWRRCHDVCICSLICFFSGGNAAHIFIIYLTHIVNVMVTIQSIC